MNKLFFNVKKLNYFSIKTVKQPQNQLITNEKMNKFKTFVSRNKLLLKPFQTECFEWCYDKEEQPSDMSEAQEQQKQVVKKGGILALEMGLGKTIIMLGLVKCNIKAQTLIVLPRSLLDQWEQSIIKFCGCKPLVYHGSRGKNMKMTLAQIKSASQIVVTTYGQMSFPSEKQMRKGRRLSPLHEIVWNRVICDEAHHVSHKKTNEFKGIKALRSEIYWLVTGTPIQNNEKELYNMYSLFGLSGSATHYNAGTNYLDTAKQMVFYSTKAGVGLALPPLHEHVEYVPWQNDSEKEFAWHIHSLLTFCNVPQKPIAAQIEQDCENVNALRMKYLARAQQVCVYPPMLNKVISHFEELMYEFQGEQGADHPLYSNMDTTLLQCSQSKIDAVLKTLMERKQNGCGKIVFCRYYAEIDALAQQLEQLDPTLRVAKFDGRVKNSKRDSLLGTPVDILLAQIKMCREGLNLQDHYSEVYFPSPDFNPATEQQAIARCWRMGQKKEVHVFRFLLGGNPPHPPSGVSDSDLANEVASPLTMDMFATRLHEKKHEFVSRMAGSAESTEEENESAIYAPAPAPAAPAPKKIKINYKK